jgi:peptidoglycan/LPS O-acetylase OafA/YrhL
LTYRPEIDGLRALAVIPVILFHAGFELFSGGFVGVDVFFVISGYLITTILIQDLNSQKFSFISFYERRARRILPALFFVMLVCIPFAWLWMLPSQMKDFSQSLVATSLFASNILFWRESGYFAAASEEKPLLHTWSLAVEEQYYLLFPLFFFLAWRFEKNRVLWIVVIIAVMSFLLSEWGWRNQPIANFYLAPTRAWELLSGSIAAFILQQSTLRKNNLYALIGLIAILLSIFIYDHNTPVPSIYALAPVLGTMLVVLFADQKTIVGRLLGTRAIVAIGLISYSAYLWHQPLFAFAKLRLDESPTSSLMIALSFASFVLAYLTWRYIETPCRYQVTKPLFISLTLIPLFVVTGVGITGHISNGFQNRIPGWSELAKVPTVNTTFCHNDGRRTLQQQLDNDYCLLGEGYVEFAIIGDSHAGALFDAAHDLLTTKGASAIAVSGAFCAPLLNGFEAGRNCRETIETAMLHAMSSKTISTVILAAEWANYTNGYRRNNKPRNWTDNQGRAVTPLDNIAIFSRSFEETINQFSNSNKQIIIVMPVPEFRYSPYNFVGKWALLNASDISTATRVLPKMKVIDYEKRNKNVIKQFNKTQSNNVKYVEVSDLFCHKGICSPVSKDGDLLYSDDNHVNYHGAKLIMQRVLKVIDRIEGS